MVGIAADDEDDDGNAASNHANGNGHSQAPTAAKRPPAGKPDNAAKTWAEEAEKAIRGFKSLDELRAWDDKNEKALTRLKSIDAALHQSVMDALADVYTKYNPLAAE